MAEVLLVVTDEARPDTAYQDGDILCAFNDRRIQCAHAEIICHPKTAQRNGSGLIVSSSVTRDFCERTRQYRFVRISSREVRRTEIATGAEEVFGLSPNAKGERINVRAYIRLRKQKPGFIVFGEDGAEVWYGGRRDYSAPVVSALWADIESKTPHRVADYPKFPLGSQDKRSFLPFSLDADCDDDEAAAMVESEVDATDPKDLVVIRKRTRRLDWRAVLASADRAKALDRALEFDARDKPARPRSEVVLKRR